MKIQLILEINVPDGIGTYEDALEYLQYEIGFGANTCSCENPIYVVRQRSSIRCGIL